MNIRKENLGLQVFLFKIDLVNQLIEIVAVMIPQEIRMSMFGELALTVDDHVQNF